ncbi:MAG: hypothetical protein RLZZ124_661, partial [Cyanobacteriota bacterium]
YLYYDATITGSFTNNASSSGTPSDSQGNTLRWRHQGVDEAGTELDIGRGFRKEVRTTDRRPSTGD